MIDIFKLESKIALGCLKAVPFCLILLLILRNNRKRIKSPALRKIIQKIFPNIYDERSVKVFRTAFLCTIDFVLLSLFITAMVCLLDSVKARVFLETYDAVIKEADRDIKKRDLYNSDWSKDEKEKGKIDE